MAYVSGDLTEITYNHPTLGNGVFNPKANEDNTFDPGGVRGNDDANQITGNGENIRQLNRVRWSVETTIAVDLNTRKEQDTLRQLAASPVEAEYTFTHISGAVYKGKGAPVGDIQPNTNAATISIKFAGGGVLEQIV